MLKDQKLMNPGRILYIIGFFTNVGGSGALVESVQVHNKSKVIRTAVLYNIVHNGWDGGFRVR